MVADARFDRIRAAWRRHGPRVIALTENGRTADPYFLDWLSEFTPIESAAWGAIRYFGIPLYPQYPALNYFIDFADPHRKVGLECDGKNFHDADRDAIRDRRLSDAGWVIYRVPGKDCMRQPDWAAIEDRCDGEPILEDTYMPYAFGSVDGAIDALAQHYYGCNGYVRVEDIGKVMRARLST